MKDPLINSLAERFADHEVPVDPGTWSAISGQLAVASGSSLSGLLQEKFAGHEAPVDAQVWTNISSQLGHGAAAGVGSTAGWWAAGIAATIVAGGFLLYNITGADTPAKPVEQPQVVTPAVPEPGTLVSASSPSADPAKDPQEKTGPAMVVPESPVKISERKAPPAMASGQKRTSEDASNKQPEHLDPNLPMPTPEGKVAVQSALQEVVDNYVISNKVVGTEPKMPPPTQKEMPSEEVHLQHPAAATDDNAEPEPEVPAIIPAAAAEVMIPNAFSPNSDGVNDELEVLGQHYQKPRVRIFSATSNALVFSADNLEARWNGRLMNTGQPCEPGMYFYALEVTGDDGRTLSKGEVVRLFR